MKVIVKRGLRTKKFEDVDAYSIAEGVFIIGNGDTSTIIPLAKIDKIVVTGIPPQLPPEPVQEKG